MLALLALCWHSLTHTRIQHRPLRSALCALPAGTRPQAPAHTTSPCRSSGDPRRRGGARMASHYYRQGGGPSMCMCIPRTIGLLRIGTVWSTWTEHSARCLTLLSAHHCPPLPLSQPMDGGPHAAHGATSQPGLWRILVQETPSRPARPSRKNALVLSLRTAYVHRYGARRTEHKHLAFFCRAGKTGLETLSRARAHLGRAATAPAASSGVSLRMYLYVC